MRKLFTGLAGSLPALCLALVFTLTLEAGAQPVPEYELKAAYIYNFGIFTEWPAGALPEGAPFAICVRQGHPMRNALAPLTKKTLKGRPLVVRTWPGVDIARDCQILLLDGADRDTWKSQRPDAAAPGVLTISDDEAGRLRAIITLTLVDGRLEFSVDTAAARQAQLNLSARLLKLARTVQ